MVHLLNNKLKKNSLVWIFVCVLFFFIFIFSCTGSALLHLSFLQLQERGLLFAVVLRLLIAVASRVMEHRL